MITDHLRVQFFRSSPRSLPTPYPNRARKGMAKCNKQYCTACPYITIGNKVKINQTKYWNITRRVSCDTFNCIYLIECKIDTCKQRYIGQTGRLLKYRLAEHRGYVSNKVDTKATGAHFNLPGHSLADLRITIIEQMKNSDLEYRKEREKYFIRFFNTYNNGLNREK